MRNLLVSLGLMLTISLSCPYAGKEALGQTDQPGSRHSKILKHPKKAKKAKKPARRTNASSSTQKKHARPAKSAAAAGKAPGKCHGALKHRASKSSTKAKGQSASKNRGVASWYGGSHHGKKTSNGERFNKRAFTAAHRSLPFGTKVLVKNERNGKSVVVRINDRGPFTGKRIIDLSEAAAREIGMINQGIAKVTLTVLA